MKNKIIILPKTKHEVQFGGNIEIDTEWKNRNVKNLTKEFSERLEKIEKDYNQVVDEMKWNELVYSAEIKFIPVIGEVYYLYERKGQKPVISLIAPHEWTNDNYLGSFKYHHTGKWIKIEKNG